MSKSSDIDIIRDTYCLYNLRHEWFSLVDHSSGTSIFHTWEWLYSWWEMLGTGNHLSVVVTRDSSNGKLCGIIPLMLSNGTLRFIGGPRPAVSYYLCPIVAPWASSDSVDRMWRCVLGDPEIGGMELTGVRFRSPWLRQLMLFWLSDTGRAVVCRAGKHTVTGEVGPDLGSTISRIVSRNTRQRMRQWLRRGMEGMVFRIAESKDEVIEITKWLGECSVRKFGRRSAWYSQKFRRFMERVCLRMLDAGWLRACTLSSGNEISAARIAFAYHGTLFFYQSGFDVKYASQRPAHRLYLYLLERACEEKIGVVDLLPEAHAYKLEYFPQGEMVADVHFVGRGPYQNASLGARFLARGVRAAVRKVFGHGC